MCNTWWYNYIVGYYIICCRSTAPAIPMLIKEYTVKTSTTLFVCDIQHINFHYSKAHRRYFVSPSSYLLTVWVAVVGCPSSFSAAALPPPTPSLRKIWLLSAWVGRTCRHPAPAVTDACHSIKKKKVRKISDTSESVCWQVLTLILSGEVVGKPRWKVYWLRQQILDCILVREWRRLETEVWVHPITRIPDGLKIGHNDVNNDEPNVFFRVFIQNSDFGQET